MIELEFEKILNTHFKNFDKNITYMTGEEIGKGMMGVVYNNKTNKNNVIKKIILCDNTHRKSCRFIKEGKKIYKKVVSEDRTNINMLFCPSIAIELFSILCMNNYYKQKLIFGIPIINGYEIVEESNNSELYIDMKKYDTFNIENENDALNMVLKIMVNIYLLQLYMRFTHYDLHWGNILYEKNKKMNVQLNTELILSFEDGMWPVIIDFGDSIFSVKETRFVNIDNISYDFNKFYDGLTLLHNSKKFISESNINKLYNCFIKNPKLYDTFFFKEKIFYKPNLDSIKLFSDQLYNPIEIITNLIKTFDNILNVKINSPYINSESYKINDSYILNEQPNYDFKNLINSIKEKKYYLNYKNDFQNEIIKVEVIKEIYSKNIFSFSLFTPNKNIENIFNFIFDPKYNIFLGNGKSGDDAFYRHYLGKQINVCINFINNYGIQVNTPGSGKYQWNDFGCLLLYDEYVLNLPMMVFNSETETYLPWSKITKNPMNIDRNILSNRLNKTLEQILSIYEWGTIKDYIMYKIESELNEYNNLRIGLYSYSFPEKYKTNTIMNLKNQNIHITNTKGNLGTIVRFMVLQDPFFDTVLFRDAHSTMPNRNYTYDREWFDTWLLSNKKFWLYSGAFYNPPHVFGLKSGFAAAWGVRKIGNNESIFSLYEYNKYFNFDKIDENKFYGMTNYGVDERIMYRFYNNEKIINQSYIVGISHLIYLIIGQNNPRINTSLLKNDPVSQLNDTPYDSVSLNNNNIIPNIGTKYPENYDIKLYCKQLDFIDRPYNFYTDLRCSFIYSLQMVCEILNKNIIEITAGEYFNELEKFLKLDPYDGSPMEQFFRKNIQMLPSKYNIWQYLFINTDNIVSSELQNVDNLNLHFYFSSLGVDILNTNLCKMNKYLWTGNIFNFDKIMIDREQITEDTPLTMLPLNYPNYKKESIPYEDLSDIHLSDLDLNSSDFDLQNED